MGTYLWDTQSQDDAKLLIVTRCLSLSSGDHCLDTSANAQFHSLCLYWQHPSLPVPLYPRYTLSSYSRPASATSPSLSLSPDMQRALHSDWMTSLQSVYQLVKARQCPYFYLLAPNFTVLFKAAGKFPNTHEKQ